MKHLLSEKAIKGVEKPKLVYQQHSKCYIYGGVNSPQAWHEGQAVTSAGSSPQVDPFTDPAWKVGGGGKNPGMEEGSVTREGDDCCSIVWFGRVLAGHPPS